MSCSKSNASCGGGSLHFIGWVILLVFGGFVIASLPEIKRYIKISSM